jgi:hypothetical protein
MRKNSCGKVDILKTDYDKNISKIPELIGKHPGVIAPVTLYKTGVCQAGKCFTCKRYHGGRSKDKGRQ